MKRRIPPSRKQIQMTQAAYAPVGVSQPSVLESLDQTAHAMERKWGIGKLRLLVSEDLRSRFDAQAEKLNAALESGQRDLIDVQAEGMKRAWTALDKAAETAGNKTVSAEIWEVRLPKSNRLVAIVRSAAHVYGGFLGQMSAWAEENKIPYQGVPVGTIKRHVTGKGNASKEEVVRAVIELHHCPMDDNEADALALLHYAMDEKIGG